VRRPSAGFSRQASPIDSEQLTVWQLPTDQAMADVFDAEYVSLHVRVTNKGAFHLYTQTLGYECGPLFMLSAGGKQPEHRLLARARTRAQLAPPWCLLTRSARPARSINDREAKYYADGEDAYDMRKKLKPAKAKAEDGKALARKAKA